MPSSTHTSGPYEAWRLRFWGDPEAAEEAVMEAFVKLYARWSHPKSIDYPPAYLRRMGR